MPQGQGDGIIPLAASKLQDNGMVITEHLLPPVALDGMILKDKRLGTGSLWSQHGRCFRLQEAAEGSILSKFFQFPVTHYFLLRFLRRFLRFFSGSNLLIASSPTADTNSGERSGSS